MPIGCQDGPAIETASTSDPNFTSGLGRSLMTRRARAGRLELLPGALAPTFRGTQMGTRVIVLSEISPGNQTTSTVPYSVIITS